MLSPLEYSKTPEQMEKCRERQKKYRQRREETLTHCEVCNRTYNDFSKYRHYNSKKHLKNLNP